MRPRSGASASSGLVSLTKPADLAAVGNLLASGEVVPAIENVYPLAETPDAMRRLAAHRVRGKVVIDPTT